MVTYVNVKQRFVKSDFKTLLRRQKISSNQQTYLFEEHEQFLMKAVPDRDSMWNLRWLVNSWSWCKNKN